MHPNGDQSDRKTKVPVNLCQYAGCRIACQTAFCINILKKALIPVSKQPKAFCDVAIQFALCDLSFSAGELSSASQLFTSHGMRHSHPVNLISVSHHSSQSHFCLCTLTDDIDRIFQDRNACSVYSSPRVLRQFQ